MPSLLFEVLIAVALLLALVLALAAARRDVFEIQREILIAAPPAKVYALLEDLRQWERWSRSEGEAAVQRRYSGAASGTGAVAEWEGAGRAGAGRMEIVEAAAPSRLLVRVEWARPFKARNLNEFTLEAWGKATRTTWAMRGSNVYMMKLMSLFLDMDKMMGRHFEAGLAGLKAAAEG